LGSISDAPLRRTHGARRQLVPQAAPHAASAVDAPREASLATTASWRGLALTLPTKSSHSQTLDGNTASA